MDFFELLIQLEDELGEKRGSIFGKKVDVEKCQAIVSELRRNFPEVIREAAMIVGEREKYLSEAKTIYDNTLREAERQVSHLVSQSELYKRAEEESKQLTILTESRCNQLVADTKKHLDETFANIEHFLSSAYNMIHNNREELRQAHIVAKAKKPPQ